jgi:hypothetical protein
LSGFGEIDGRHRRLTGGHQAVNIAGRSFVAQKCEERERV